MRILKTSISVILKVWGITNNPDGSISLNLANVALEIGDDGKIYSTLPVMPWANGYP